MSIKQGFLAVALLTAGCTTPATREPANLSRAKAELGVYVESGRYERDLAAVAAEAAGWLRERTKSTSGEKLTVVFDLDETLLSNLSHMKSLDFGYVPPEWERWVDAGSAPAIEPVRDVYRLAQVLGLHVVFITGRRERDRPGTERNLKAIGCGNYTELVCRPADDRGATAAFKSAIRRRLTERGHTIIANIGDQESDLVGGFAERAFKLPNPFYLTE